MESVPIASSGGAASRSGKQGLQEYIELLRYGPRAHRTPGVVHATLSQISKMVKLSATKV
jgi:hypothetical protein